MMRSAGAATHGTRLASHLDDDSNPWMAAAKGPRSSAGAAGFRSFSTSPKGPRSSKESAPAGGDAPPAGGRTDSKGPRSSVAAAARPLGNTDSKGPKSSAAPALFCAGGSTDSKGPRSKASAGFGARPWSAASKGPRSSAAADASAGVGSNLERRCRLRADSASALVASAPLPVNIATSMNPSKGENRTASSAEERSTYSATPTPA
mmetsp:Transcript_87690/g.220684  ORF Transcript_87690/g.220684 Transcript_87690/m.220684 type:complete len:206 (-) Transcript_87690:1564-2181(-)